MTFAVAVLAASHEQPVAKWTLLGSKWQSQVWVATSSTISNALLWFAFAEGVAIYFWNRACAGATVSAISFFTTVPLYGIDLSSVLVVSFVRFAKGGRAQWRCLSSR